MQEHAPNEHENLQDRGEMEKDSEKKYENNMHWQGLNLCGVTDDLAAIEIMLVMPTRKLLGTLLSLHISHQRDAIEPSRDKPS